VLARLSTPPRPPSVFIGLRGAASNSTASASTQLSVSAPAGLAANDVMLAQIAVAGGTNIAVTAPAGWNLVRRDNQSTSIAQAIYSHAVSDPSAEPSSYAWSFSGSANAAGAVIAYYGVSGVADASNGQGNASSTNITAPSLVVPAAHTGDLLVALFSTANATQVTLPTPTLPRWNFSASSGGVSIAASDLLLGTDGATGNEVATAGNSAASAGALVALVPQAGAVATPTPVSTPSASTASPTPTPAATSIPTPIPTQTSAATPAPTPSGTSGLVTLRNVSTGSTATVSTQLALSVPAGVQAGDLMIAQIAVRGGTALTITSPAGWNLVRRDDSSTTVAQAVYSRPVPSSPSEPASYTWTFSGANDAAGGIAAYSGASAAAPIDASNGQGNASSVSITAPSITVPAGHNQDRLLNLFAIANSSAVTVPAGTTSRWSFHATGGGIGVAASDVQLVSSGPTGNLIATAASAANNAGSLIALLPGPGTGPTPTPAATATPGPSATATAVSTATVIATPQPTSSSTPRASTTSTPTPAASPTPAPTPAPSPAPTPGAIGLRAIQTASTSVLGTQLAIGVPAGVQANDLLIAEIAVRGGSALVITAPASWTLVRRDNSSSTVAQAIYEHPVTVPSAEPATYTWTFSNANDAAGGILAYADASGAAPIDVSNGQGNASSISITAPSITVPPGHASDLLVGIFSIANSSSVTVPAGMTQRWSFHATGGGIGIAASDQQLSAGGAVGNESATAATAGANAGALLALSPQ
jgi:hypothetical protein